MRSHLEAQDDVIHRDQAREAGLTPEAIRYKLRASQWTRLLPEVYLARPGDPTRRQMLVAALLFAGPGAQIDGVDACRFHGIRCITHDEHRVQVMVPQDSQARSTGFVVVRRSNSQVPGESTALLRYVDPATAVIAATRRMSKPRPVLAALSEALQRNITTYDDLLRAHIDGPPRNSRLTSQALEQLGDGIRSMAEADFRKIATKSRVLPALEFNVWLRLRCGRVVCVDALIRSSAVVHEVNGRVAHAREDLFEDMQERHDAITTSGFTVLHNSPRRVLRSGEEVVAQVEKCHVMYDGRGMPTGVEIIARAA
jgi:very-short-patch-repair endonuclease